MIKGIITTGLIIFTVSAEATTLYQNDFNAGAASLSGFSAFGTATVQPASGQVAIGVTNFDRGGISLNTASLGGFSTTLGANAGMLQWAFNVTYLDGAYNNMFSVVLAGNTSDPYNFNFPAQGYSLKGGGYVGNRMLLSRFDHGLNTYQVLIDIPDAAGLAPFPQTGMIRVTYNPNNDAWSLYMDASATPYDPTTASSLLGTAVDGTYTHSPLPYFSLGAETSGTEYFDNLSISVVPEPSTLSLIVVGLTALGWQTFRYYRTQKAHTKRANLDQV